MPRVATIVPIPRKFEAAGIRRYGFHGLSYAFLMEEIGRVAGAVCRRGPGDPGPPGVRGEPGGRATAVVDRHDDGAHAVVGPGHEHPSRRYRPGPRLVSGRSVRDRGRGDSTGWSTTSRACSGSRKPVATCATSWRAGNATLARPKPSRYSATRPEKESAGSPRRSGASISSSSPAASAKIPPRFARKSAEASEFLGITLDHERNRANDSADHDRPIPHAGARDSHRRRIDDRQSLGPRLAPERIDASRQAGISRSGRRQWGPQGSIGGRGCLPKIHAGFLERPISRNSPVHRETRRCPTSFPKSIWHGTERRPGRSRTSTPGGPTSR